MSLVLPSEIDVQKVIILWRAENFAVNNKNPTRMYNFRNFIGSKGLAQTKLCPIGFIEINGQQFDAVIRNGPKIEQGSEVEVIDAICSSLVVKELIK